MTRKALRGTSGKRSQRFVQLEVLVEEQSASEALKVLLPRIVQDKEVRVKIHPFRGKPDLLKNLPVRLRGYAAARNRGEDIRIVVLVDQDTDNCGELKKILDAEARKAGLTPRADKMENNVFHVLNRIAMRELESWYFGDWGAVRKGFPRVSSQVPKAYRGNPDVVSGKCSDAFERVLRACGIRIVSKPDWGRRIGPHMDVSGNNRSPSFRAFVDGIRDISAS